MSSAQTQSSPKRTQAPCCYTSAMDATATFCGTCGKPLMRCMAADECGGLLDDHGLCSICVDLSMQVDAGALTAARVGDTIALPLSFVNASIAGRPLFITGLWSSEGGTDNWREEPLGWERLDARDHRPATITVRDINRAGTHQVQLRVAVSNLWQWRKESYVFGADFTLTVIPEKGASGHNVNIGGETAGHGNIVYITDSGNKTETDTRSDAPIALTLTRIEKIERALGLRGLHAGVWVPRNTALTWQGFAPLEAPVDGPITTRDGVLIAGRSRNRRQSGDNDLRLLIQTPNGEIDEPLSLTLSRQHFELYIECDRFMLRVITPNGLRIDGKAYGPDKTIQLKDGTRISPLVHAPNALSLITKFHTEHGRVTRITLTRTPESYRE